MKDTKKGNVKRERRLPYISTAGVRDSIQTRLMLARDYAHSMRQCDERDLTLKNQLMLAAPKGLHEFLKTSEVLDDLFNTGGSYRKVFSSNSTGRYSLGGPKHTKMLFKRLREDWSKSVNVKLTHVKGDEFSLVLKMV